MTSTYLESSPRGEWQDPPTSSFIAAEHGFLSKKLESNDIDSGHEFRISVAINGDRVVVGEHFEDRDALGGAAMKYCRCGVHFRSRRRRLGPTTETSGQ